MKEPILDENQVAGLDALAKLGSEKVASALSKWLGTSISPKDPDASMVHYSALADPSFPAEDPVTAILIKVSGDIDGYLLFLFDEKSSLKITARILRRNTDSTLLWDDLTRSVMEETGNIIGAAFLNAIAASLDIEIYPSSPVTAFDISGAILETIMAQLALNGEYYLRCRTSFYSGMDEIRGAFAMIPENTSILEYL